MTAKTNNGKNNDNSNSKSKDKSKGKSKSKSKGKSKGKGKGESKSSGCALGWGTRPCPFRPLERLWPLVSVGYVEERVMPQRLMGSVAAVGAAAVGGWFYAALWPESQLFGRVMVAPGPPNEIALTYDDGPNDGVTERLLEVLARHEVRATFFLIGSFVRQRPALTRAIAAAGHVVGNHTATHPWLAFASSARIRRELVDCNAALEDALGTGVRYFRPPHGARRPYVLQVARELGLVPVQWNVMAYDWKPTDASAIAFRVAEGVTRNQRLGRASNVLLHDGGHLGIGAERMASVEATELVVERYRQMGARFVTVADWG
jgi:peptidoglycan/xylan/chitin deacetylase (PgdA/CDA1 family)